MERAKSVLWALFCPLYAAKKKKNLNVINRIASTHHKERFLYFSVFACNNGDPAVIIIWKINQVSTFQICLRPYERLLEGYEFLEKMLLGALPHENPWLYIQKIYTMNVYKDL